MTMHNGKFFINTKVSCFEASKHGDGSDCVLRYQNTKSFFLVYNNRAVTCMFCSDLISSCSDFISCMFCSDFISSCSDLHVLQ